MELIEISRNHYYYKDDFDVEQLLKIKDQMENTLDLKVSDPIIAGLLEKKAVKKETDSSGMPVLKDLDDQQITVLARTALASFKLDEQELPNIITEMKAYRLFHNRCTDDNIEILQVYTHERIIATSYKDPVKFVLRSKLTGIQTKESSDMDELLKAWGL